MGFIALILVMIFARKTEKKEIPVWSFIAANVIAALVFSAGHLPATQMPYDDTNEEYNRMIQSVLMGLQGEFHRYFNGEDPDPKRDLLTVGSASLMMNDEETMEFIKAYGELIQKYMPNKPAEGRKVRKVTFVISPNEY